MAQLRVRLEWLTGVNRPIFQNVRLVGSWLRRGGRIGGWRMGGRDIGRFGGRLRCRALAFGRLVQLTCRHSLARVGGISQLDFPFVEVGHRD